MERRIVGVDFGTRRVGIALSDPLRLFAQPLGTYAPDEAIEVVGGIADRDGVEVIVFGWPLDADGNENASTERVAAYADRVAQRLANHEPPVTIEKWDERGSSREAVEELIRAGAKRKQRGRGGAADRVAAAIILQQYLDERNAGHSGAF
jgi:putative Holliday junction resolvase